MPDLDQYLQHALPAPGGWLPTDLRRAAVLCPILAHQGRDHVLFVLRPEGTQAHAGQIAFPGGMHAGTESPLQTAMRESLEEVGAPGDNITPLGELEPRESTSKIHVHCVVARVAPFDLRPDPREVARILHMPLDELRDDTRWQEKPPPIATPGIARRTGPHFPFGEDLLWGLTARFIRDLVALIPRGTE
ncbi:MAG: 8-oxo-dGTP pyrophosphatase MutT (NUDIX family) [Planctomycetota bacterium]